MMMMMMMMMMKKSPRYTEVATNLPR